MLPTPSSSVPGTTRVDNSLADQMAEPPFLDPVQDFTDFVDTMGFSSDWNMFEIPPVENDPQLTQLTSEELSVPSLESISPEVRPSNPPLLREPQQSTFTPCFRDNDEILEVGEEEPSMSATLPLSPGHMDR